MVDSRIMTQERAREETLRRLARHSLCYDLADARVRTARPHVLESPGVPTWCGEPAAANRVCIHEAHQRIHHRALHAALGRDRLADAQARAKQFL